MSQMELFEENNQTEPDDLPDENTAVNAAASAPGTAADIEDLFELSQDAYYTALYARMSELPIKKEISGFIRKVRKAGNRAAAAKIAADRGDPDTLTVLKAAYKVQHEIHRMTGLLRFSPDTRGIYIARCAPDHYILPALAEHFTLRFGETPWAIIDESRNLCLFRPINSHTRLVPIAVDPSAPDSGLNTSGSDLFYALGPDTAPTEAESADVWEDLWRLYHRSVNNETRKNLQLQRQFMPVRYHKYLSELQKK